MGRRHGAINVGRGVRTFLCVTVQAAIMFSIHHASSSATRRIRIGGFVIYAISSRASGLKLYSYCMMYRRFVGRLGPSCLMFGAKREIIFHDIILHCQAPHFIKRLQFFYKRKINTWIRKYNSDDYTLHGKEQFQKKLKNPVTELEILDLFKMAASPHYIIPHIDIGIHKHNTGRQIKRRRTNSDCEESESEWDEQASWSESGSRAPAADQEQNF